MDAGYTGHKTAYYALVAGLRPPRSSVHAMRAAIVRAVRAAAFTVAAVERALASAPSSDDPRQLALPLRSSSAIGGAS